MRPIRNYNGLTICLRGDFPEPGKYLRMPNVNAIECAAGNNGIGQFYKIFNSMVNFHANFGIGNLKLTMVSQTSKVSCLIEFYT